MPHPIALISDFGTHDWYAPVMKSVILSIHPEAQILDITHQISSQNVGEAAFVLWNSYTWFPKQTIFVAVVDPEVGSNRKILLVETAHHYLIAPDNGILDWVLSETEVKRVIEVSNKKYFLENVCSTFHGRDIFAPVAAHLSKGVALENFGTEINPPFIKSPFITVQHEGHYQGDILYVDTFGNLITNFKINSDLKGHIKINQFLIPSISTTFSSVVSGDIVAYKGSSGLLEIAIRNGNAAKQLQAGFQTKISLHV